MGKFDGYLLCTDMDGTLTDHRCVITPKNAEALTYFTAEGGLATFATGRSPGFLTRYYKTFRPNTMMVCFNGGLIYDPVRDREVKWLCLPDDGEDVCRYVARNYPETSITNSDKVCLDGSTESLIRIVFHQPEEETIVLCDDLRRTFGHRYSFVKAWSTGIEMLAHDASKGNGIKLIRELETRKITKVIGVGDYENDISMFRVSDISYATANAYEATKKAAGHVTVSCENDAIWHVITELG